MKLFKAVPAMRRFRYLLKAVTSPSPSVWCAPWLQASSAQLSR